MKGQENLTAYLQENLLTLLCYDEQSIPFIVSAIDVNHFESSILRDIAKRAIDYFDEYKKPVGAHLPDVLEDRLLSKDKDKVEIYHDTLVSLNNLNKKINRTYVLEKLEKFVNEQEFKIGLRSAAELMAAGKFDDAVQAVEDHKQKRLKIFDPGTRLSDKPKVGVRLDKEKLIYTGIDSLDALHICPYPREMWLLLGASGKGKSYCLGQLGKYALIQRKKVLHVTVGDLTEEMVHERYIQSFIGVAKSRERLKKTPYIRSNAQGYFEEVSFDYPPNIKFFEDPDIGTYIRNSMRKKKYEDLIIKYFPARQLTFKGFKTYVQMLELREKFRPDLIIVDYPDKFYIDPDNLRIATGILYDDLRGFAGEEHYAMAAVTQSNRAAENAPLITREHLGEDYTKVQGADNLIILNKTRAEEALGLARLYHDKIRNDESGGMSVIGQNLSIAQFALSSALMTNKYEDMLKEITEPKTEKKIKRASM